MMFNGLDIFKCSTSTILNKSYKFIIKLVTRQFKSTLTSVKTPNIAINQQVTTNPKVLIQARRESSFKKIFWRISAHYRNI